MNDGLAFQNYILYLYHKYRVNEKGLIMRKSITKEQYELALERIEMLLPLVDDNMPATDKQVVELALMSDIVIEYEKEHFPISKPNIAEIIELSL